jgi:hypothetical protein
MLRQAAFQTSAAETLGRLVLRALWPRSWPAELEERGLTDPKTKAILNLQSAVCNSKHPRHSGVHN